MKHFNTKLTIELWIVAHEHQAAFRENIYAVLLSPVFDINLQIYYWPQVLTPQYHKFAEQQDFISTVLDLSNEELRTIGEESSDAC